MSTKQAAVKVRAIKVDPADPTSGVPSFLIVDLTVDCPDCGTYQVRFMGHHLRTIRDALVQIIDEFPEVTGTDAHTHTVRRESWGATPPGDPSLN